MVKPRRVLEAHPKSETFTSYVHFGSDVEVPKHDVKCGLGFCSLSPCQAPAWVRFPGVPLIFPSHWPLPPVASEWGLPAVLGLQKLLGCGHEAFAGSGRTLYFFISDGLSPLASRKPLFKINTGKMCYTVSYNTIQSSTKYQTLFKQSSWLDWQIYKSKEIQRGGLPLSRPLSVVRAALQSFPARGAGRFLLPHLVGSWVMTPR